MVEHWICNQRVTGSNPVTVILRTSVLWIFFLIFKIKNSRYPPFARCLARPGRYYACQSALDLTSADLKYFDFLHYFRHFISA